ncbi:MAG: hypothetical protein MK171_02950 [Pirellulales bacterium]|nr:hypothetical protein [Pirellulales bacterium]
MGNYYFNDMLPTSGMSTDGAIDIMTTGALNSSKLKDLDTSPDHPTRVALGD